MFPQAVYDETALPLAPGDLVIFFSDGITDARNSRGDDFGSQNLQTLLLHHPTAATGAQSAVSAILEAVTTHQSGAEHFDDETLVALWVR
jgi:sigma-B regulation protein RsbU (phosphoserine phosphatase)